MATGERDKKGLWLLAVNTAVLVVAVVLSRIL